MELLTRRKREDLLAAHEFGSVSLDLAPEVRGTDGLVARWRPQTLSQLCKFWDSSNDRKLDYNDEKKHTCNLWETLYFTNSIIYSINIQSGSSYGSISTDTNILTVAGLPELMQSFDLDWRNVWKWSWCANQPELTVCLYENTFYFQACYVQNSHS